MELVENIGFAAYLTKPVRQAVLFDCLKLVSGFQADPTGCEDRAVLTHHLISEEKKKGVRILVAEDDVVNQMAVERILKNAGFWTKIVSDGREAADAVEDRPFDLVFMDDGRDRTMARPMLGRGLAVSAFRRYMPG